MRFEDLLARHEGGELTQEEAGELLGMSGRTFRRWREWYREDGEAGLVDRRAGKRSPHRAPESELARRALYEEMYGGFTVKHFHERLVKQHGYRLGYTYAARGCRCRCFGFSWIERRGDSVAGYKPGSASSAALKSASSATSSMIGEVENSPVLSKSRGVITRPDFSAAQQTAITCSSEGNCEGTISLMNFVQN
jgi:transposase